MHFKKLLLDFVTEPNPMYAMVKWLAETIMRMEAESLVGEEKFRHSKTRETHFSGYRIRRFNTQLGTIYLSVPKLRNGGYIPSFLTDNIPAEQAMLKVIQEAFIKSVSMRTIQRLINELRIVMLSDSHMMKIKRGLDKQVEYFRNRELEICYPILWVDEMFEKVRMNGRQVKMGVIIISAISKSGIRDILTVNPIYRESEETYKSLFNHLKERGLKDVWLVVSDNYLGIKKAVKECFRNSAWQRCQVHLLRNILSTVNPRDRELVASKIKRIWNQETKGAALQLACLVIDELEEIYPAAARTLKEGHEDSLNFYAIDGFKMCRNI